jgi:hypothetical protein
MIRRLTNFVIRTAREDFPEQGDPSKVTLRKVDPGKHCQIDLAIIWAFVRIYPKCSCRHAVALAGLVVISPLEEQFSGLYDLIADFS